MNNKLKYRMLKLKFLKARTIDKNVKCTIRKNGALGFTIPAIQKLQLDEKKHIQIAINEIDTNDTSLYMVVTETPEDGAFPVKKVGDYCHINTRALFDDLAIDYGKGKTIVYDILDFEYENQPMYKLLRREITKRDKK